MFAHTPEMGQPFGDTAKEFEILILKLRNNSKMKKP
jgi:hypothetical protein